MKFRILIPLLALLVLPGCVSGGNIFDLFNPKAPSVLQGGVSVTSQVENPVSRNNLAAIELSYNGIVAGMNAYYARPLCKAGTSASWDNLCSEPAARRELAKYRKIARAAILKARAFSKTPNVSAVDVIRAAGNAVSDMKAVATINGVKTQ